MKKHYFVFLLVFLLAFVPLVSADQALQDNLLAYWSLNGAEKNSSHYYDVHTNNFPLRIINSPTMNVTGKNANTGEAVTFSAASSQTLLGQDWAGLEFSRNEPWSVMALVKTTSTTWSATGKRGTSPPDASNAGYTVYVPDGNGKVTAYFTDTAGSQIRMQTSPTINNGSWVQVVVTCAASCTASNMSFYMDGNPVSASTVNNALSGATEGDGKFALSSRSGQNDFGTNTIDEYAVWNTTLNSSQVAALYDSGSICNYDCIVPTVPNGTLELKIENVIDGVDISGFCANVTSLTTTQKKCTNSTTVSFNSSEIPLNQLYDILWYEIANTTFYNRTQLDYNFSDSATITQNTYQALLNITAFQLYTNTTIVGFNITNGIATNTTTTTHLTVPAKNGTNNLTLDHEGNYSLSFSCLITTILTTSACQAEGVYDTIINITARDIIASGSINNFNTTMTSSIITGSVNYNTSSGNISFPAIQGQTYSFLFNSPLHALANTTIEANQSLLHYEFDVYRINSLNITFYDETSGTPINFQNVSINFLTSGFSQTNTTNTSQLYVDLLDPATYTLQYSSLGYLTRYYSYTIANQTHATLNLTLLNSTVGSSVTITVIDNLEQILEGYTIRVKKQSLVTGNFELIETLTTNFEGQSLANLVLNTAFYQFTILNTEGTIVYTSSSTQIFGDTLTFIIENEPTIGFNKAFSYSGVVGNITFLRNTNEFKFVYDDNSNQVTSARLTTYRLGTTRTQTNNSVTSTSSGTIYAGINNQSGTAHLAIGRTTINGNEFIVSQHIVTFGEELPEDGSVPLMMFLITITFFTLASSVEIAVIVASLVPLLFVIMGLSTLGYTTAIGIVFAGFVVAYVLGAVK